MDAAGFLPEGGVPANWQVYFAVENTDASIETALQLGGRIIQAAEDTPFGRMETLIDPTGSSFRIAQPIPQGT